MDSATTDDDQNEVVGRYLGRYLPNIIHTNTLGKNIVDIQQKDSVNVVLAKPPFGGKEHAEVQAAKALQAIKALL